VSFEEDSSLLFSSSSDDFGVSVSVSPLLLLYTRIGNPGTDERMEKFRSRICRLEKMKINASEN
jgi:hypothetical protein